MAIFKTEAVFSAEGLDNLSARLDESESLEDFFSYVDFLVLEGKYLLPLPNEIVFSTSLDAHNDGDSAVVLFEAIGDIDRANAADPRLWSFLALVTLRDYLVKRWPRISGNEWKAAIKERGLLKTPSRRKLIRHGIARLWWVANLTYDPGCGRPLSSEKEDPHAYTRWVFKNQNRIQSIFERQLGSNPPVMWAIIETLAKDEANSLSPGDKEYVAKSSETDLVKKVTKEVHLRSGYRHLEVLDEEELREVIDT